MAFEIKGDVLVKRTLVAERRADQGLLETAALAATLALTRHCARWQRISTDDNGNQDITLPDATTLPDGWEVIVHNFGSVDSLVVKDGGAGATLKTIGLTAPVAYRFSLMDNSAAAGIWYIERVEDDLAPVPATRYVKTFDAGADWGAAAAGYYTITVTQATHLRGVNPSVQMFEDVAGDLIEIKPDRLLIASTGNTSFRVPDAPDLRFAGKALFL